MLDYKVCKDWAFEDRLCTYSTRDTILYALGLGIGASPTDTRQLRWVYERDLVAMPTMATVIGAAGMWMADPRTGIDATRLVHGEQHLELHRPLPASGSLLSRHAVESVVDKGHGKGALLITRKELLDPRDQGLVCVSRSVSFLRANGGFSEISGRSDEPPDRLPAVPSEPPHASMVCESLPQAALIYRLSGDLNPLHADPDVARRAGFERPILHGLCSFGMAAWAAIELLMDGDASRLRRFATRFTAPVWPGEKIRIDTWCTGPGQARLRATVAMRDSVVLDCGVVSYRATPS